MKIIPRLACLLTAVVASGLQAQTITQAPQPQPFKQALQQASVAEHRSAQHIARNDYRHPLATLDFFGVEAGMTVIEISPGGMWYSEILAPALKGRGLYVAAGYDVSVADQPGYRYKQQAALEARIKDQPELYGDIKLAMFSLPDSVNLGAPASADAVLTFRNTHGWVRDGVAGQAFASFFEVLKPGGVLGLVQHRRETTSDEFTGYLSEQQIIELAQAAGFVLEARSEINANPKDLRDHPKGVWTLPPSLRLAEQDREKYLAIGESDRMTLRFRKPG